MGCSSSKKKTIKSGQSLSKAKSRNNSNEPIKSGQGLPEAKSRNNSKEKIKFSQDLSSNNSKEEKIKFSQDLSGNNSKEEIKSSQGVPEDISSNTPKIPIQTHQRLPEATCSNISKIPTKPSQVVPQTIYYNNIPTIPIVPSQTLPNAMCYNRSSKIPIETCQGLSEAIYCNNKQEITTKIKQLIKLKVKVQCNINSLRSYCVTHLNYFNSYSIIKNENSVIPYSCSYSHSICSDCMKHYVKQGFQYYYFQNLYECPACNILNIQGTRLFADDYLIANLKFVFGDDAINCFYANLSISKHIPNNPSQPTCSSALCQSCLSRKPEIFCVVNHGICQICIKNWIRNKPRNLNCFIRNCSNNLNAKQIINQFQFSNILYNIKDLLESSGFDLYFCEKCRFPVIPSYSSDTITCKNRDCKALMCSQCLKQDHFGYTCYYNVTESKYKVISLHPPAILDRPKTLLDFEYLKAKYAFNNFVNPSSGYSFKSVRLIVNKRLEERYAKKKIKMAEECGKRGSINEVFVWHGSLYENYESIMKNGLKVGGVDYNIEVKTGTVHGYGVYSSINPDDPIRYASDSKVLICCLGMKGVDNKSAIFDIKKLDNGRTHSYSCNTNWVVFFTKEQLLPRYLIEYKRG